MSRNENIGRSESQSDKFDRAKRVFGPAVLSLGSLAIIMLLRDVSNTEASVHAGSKYEGKCDESIEAIVITDGATLRSDPQRIEKDGYTNNLVTLNLDGAKSVIVDTPDGACVSHDVNGTWFGMNSDDLGDSLKAASIEMPDTSDDEDGIIWVNGQMSSAVIDQAEN